MKKIKIYFILGFFVITKSFSLDLKFVNSFEVSKSLGKGYVADFACFNSFNNYQIFCSAYLPNSSTKNIDYIQNFLSGNIEYIFPDNTKFYKDHSGFILDKYGKYIFLEKENEIQLFNCEKKEISSKEYISATNKNIFFICEEEFLNEAKKVIVKYDLLTNKKTEINFKNELQNHFFLEKTKDLYLSFNQNESLNRNLDKLADNKLLLSMNNGYFILQLNGDETEIIDIYEYFINDYEKYDMLKYYDENYMFAFKMDSYENYTDAMQSRIFLLDNKGALIKEFTDITLIRNGLNSNSYCINCVCMIDSTKRYLLLFDEFTIYIYEILK